MNLKTFLILSEKVWINIEKWTSLVIFDILEYPKERVGNNGSLILLPLLYPSTDLTSSQILSDSSNLSTSVVQDFFLVDE
jgi:hypothetical protein